VLGSYSPFCSIYGKTAEILQISTVFELIMNKNYILGNPEKPDSILKYRNEPCTLVRVVEGLAKLIGVTEE
jgi:hypothetical protein